MQRGQGCVEYAMIIGLIVVVVLVVTMVLYPSFSHWHETGEITLNTGKTRLELYEAEYNACLVKETITSDRCHDLAQAAAYGD